MKYFTVVFIAGCMGLTVANIDKSLQNLNIAGMGELPGNITSNIPSESDVEEMLTKKCEKHMGAEAKKIITTAKNEAVECIKGQVDINQLQEEMEKAKPTGDLDSVFKKYCKRTPEFKKCISNFTDSLKPCLEEDEKESMTTILNVTEQVAEFVCYKEGDRIALFIAEGGPECFESSKEGITECSDSILKKHLPNSNNVTVSDIPLLLFKAEQCEDFHKFQTCVVKKLEKCKEPTPANIVDSLFTYIRKVTPCSKYKFEEKGTEASAGSSKSSADHQFVSSSFLMLLTCLTFLRFSASHSH